jgi:hypothetical protein
MKTNRFDLAGLADSDYHIGDDGVALLSEGIISNCGYQSFHVDHPEDVLLCFQEIINLHRLVVQTWTNTRTHFSGPVVEYIIEKALPVFPRLLNLDVSGTVKFYDGLQKISMRYLLPLMPFDSISLLFGYEGLCPPGLGTTRYSAIASAWMDGLMPLCPNHRRDSQRNDGVTAGHHAPTCAVKTLLGEWKELKGKSSSEGEGPVEGVLPLKLERRTTDCRLFENFQAMTPPAGS